MQSQASKSSNPSKPLKTSNTPKRLNSEIPLTQGELAMRYFSDCDKISARRKLAKWFKNDPRIMVRLEAAGYKRHQRFYTPRQLQIVYHHLGYPATL